MKQGQAGNTRENSSCVKFRSGYGAFLLATRLVCADRCVPLMGSGSRFMNMPSFYNPICACVALFLSAGFAAAQTVDELLAKGEAHDAKFEAAEALKYYQEAEKQQPNDV